MSYEAYQHWKTHPLDQQPELSIIIPTYNEAVRIVPTIGAIAASVSLLGRPWELIIADDGSTDTTIMLVESLKLANTRIVPAPQNQGKGSAVRRGMLAARGDWLLFADADNSTPIEELPRLLAAIEQQGFDIAVGSRAASGASEANRSLLRRTMSGMLRSMVRYGLNVEVQDTQCGFKLFARPVARRLYQAQQMTGFAFDLEILYLASKLGYRVAEIPVAWVDAPGSKVRPLRDIRRFMRDMLAIKLNDLRGSYAAI